MLKAIESQHGLLIERADELWSFSHLTFQEHFTVQWLTQLSFEQLAEKITNQQWQHVVRQLVGSQQPADRLVKLIRQAIERSVSHEPEITQFLTWVLQKAKSIQLPYKSVAIRAFYFAFDRSLDYGRTVDRSRAINCARTLYRAIDQVHTLDHNVEVAYTLVRDLDLILASVRTLDLNRVNALDPGRMSDLAHVYRDLAINLDHNLNFSLALAIARDHARKQALKSLSELATQLEQIKSFLPRDPDSFWQWWQTKGNEWTQQLQQMLTEHLSMGYVWSSTEPPRQQLQSYYDGNKFLFELLNIKGAVSDSVRAEIEDTLLLPWDELQRRQPDVYGQPQSASPSPARVFTAYSHEDEDLREELDRRLADLKCQGKIQAWHRGAIEAGAEWDAAIKQQLETAQIILLLISADFIASDHCYDLLQQSLQRHHAGTARVIPIILSPTDLKNSPFNHLSLLPTDGVPITRWSNRDEAFLNVVEGIRVAIESITK